MSAADVRALLTRHLPDMPVGAVVPLGAGLDNQAFEVDGRLVVRFRREPGWPDRSAAVEREARLLAVVGRMATVAVPVVRHVLPAAGCLVLDRLPGTPLLDHPPPARAAAAVPVARTLGSLIGVLAAVPASEVDGIVAVDDTPTVEWRDDAAETYRAVRDEVPARYRPAVERFLRRPPPPDPARPAFAHNDLGIEHVLVDTSGVRVTGVLDWTDAALADPAHDLGLVLRDLGPPALDAAIDALAGSAAADLRGRAWFHARCAVLEDLAYGLRPGNERYADKSRAGLEWLFADAS